MLKPVFSVLVISKLPSWKFELVIKQLKPYNTDANRKPIMRDSVLKEFAVSASGNLVFQNIYLLKGFKNMDRVIDSLINIFDDNQSNSKVI